MKGGGGGGGGLNEASRDGMCFTQCINYHSAPSTTVFATCHPKQTIWKMALHETVRPSRFENSLVRMQKLQ